MAHDRLDSELEVDLISDPINCYYILFGVSHMVTMAKTALSQPSSLKLRRSVTNNMIAFMCFTRG